MDAKVACCLIWKLMLRTLQITLVFCGFHIALPCVIAYITKQSTHRIQASFEFMENIHTATKMKSSWNGLVNLKQVILQLSQRIKTRVEFFFPIFALVTFQSLIITTCVFTIAVFNAEKYTIRLPHKQIWSIILPIIILIIWYYCQLILPVRKSEKNSSS